MVVIGGGFGGMQVVKHLKRAPVSVTLIDRRNFHLFQPLTYQVATGALSPSDVTYPLRALFGSYPHVVVLLEEVTGFDLDARKVLLATDERHEAPSEIEYDTLVVAAGSSYSYFGHDEWREVAGEVKSLESAIAVRSRVLDAFERAEATTDPADCRAELTFVIVGAGPTGVEIAGQIAELARATLQHHFKKIDPSDARILLVETADRILTTFPPSLSKKASRGAREARRDADAQADRGRHRPRRRLAAGARRRGPAGAGANRDLGGRSTGVAARRAARRAGARGRRQGGTGDRRSRSDAARPPRGDRARRHGACQRRRRRRRPAARCRPGRDPAGRLRRARDHRPSRRQGDAAVQIPRQGQPGDDRPWQRGRRPAAAPAQRPAGLGHLASSSTSGT